MSLNIHCLCTVFFFLRYESWLRGEDYGPHPEDPNGRPTAAPVPQYETYCGKGSDDSDLPKNKRHTIHKKKNVVGVNPDVNLIELPPDVKKALQDIELNEPEEETPIDEQQLELYEDYWLKAEEMGKFTLQ